MAPFHMKLLFLGAESMDKLEIFSSHLILYEVCSRLPLVL